MPLPAFLKTLGRLPCESAAPYRHPRRATPGVCFLSTPGVCFLSSPPFSLRRGSYFRGKLGAFHETDVPNRRIPRLVAPPPGRACPPRLRDSSESCWRIAWHRAHSTRCALSLPPRNAVGFVLRLFCCGWMIRIQGVCLLCVRIPSQSRTTVALLAKARRTLETRLANVRASCLSLVCALLSWQEGSILSKYLSHSLPAKLSAVLSVLAVAVAAALFYG